MTMPIETVEVECPNCGHRYEDWQRRSVNLDLDDFDEAYLDECSSAVCPQCKFKVRFESLIVRDGTLYLPEGN